ncbi:phosphate regulon sensor histidine kinase PhoR [Paraglaciecola aestuariivivens]
MKPALIWLMSLARVLTVLVISALIGLYTHQLELALLLGVSSILCVHYWHIYKLNFWLTQSKKISPPKTAGIWSHIFQNIHQLNLQNRNKRKSLGEALRRYYLGSEALPDATVVLGAKGEVKWCNRLARIELGLNWPQDEGKKITELLSISSFTEYFIGQGFDLPLEITSPINPDKILEFRAVPYAEQYTILLARDVTRLTQIEKMRKDFVANVSHELKTPLTVISGYLEMLPEDGKVPEALMSKAIHEMRSQSLRMQSLIEELLELSRIEASAERAFEKLVNVPQLIWQIQAEAEALNRDKQHKLFFDISPILYVYGIESELRSAFSNLIFNAIHYTPAKGVIEVKWGLEGKQVKFSVKDNGDGIAPEHLERLTERFYRVDKARSRQTGGSGLGLAIVKHVLSHHNSSLQITSRVGKGSTFSCSFSPEMTYIVDTHLDPY